MPPVCSASSINSSWVFLGYCRRSSQHLISLSFSPAKLDDIFTLSLAVPPFALLRALWRVFLL